MKQYLRNVLAITVSVNLLALILTSSAAAEKITLNEDWTYELGDWTYDVDVNDQGTRVVAMNREEGLLCLDGSGKLLGRYGGGGKRAKEAFITKTEDKVVSFWGSSYEGYIAFTDLQCNHIGGVNLGEDVIWRPDANADGSRIAIIKNPLDNDLNVVNGTLMHITDLGEILWQKQLPGEPWLVRYASGMILVGTGAYLDTEHSDFGNYIYRGESAILVYDEQGNELWQYSWGVDTDKALLDISVSESPTYVVVGADDRNAYLFSETGNMLWNHHGGGYVAISRDAEVVVSASLKAYTLDIDGNEVFVSTDKGMIEAVALSANGSMVTIGGLLGSFDSDAVEVYFAGGTVIGRVDYSDFVQDVAMTSTGSLLVVSSKNVYGYSIGKKTGGDTSGDAVLAAAAAIILFLLIVVPIAYLILRKKEEGSEDPAVESTELDDDSLREF